METAGFGFVEVGMEDNVGTATGGPADGFRVAPAFVADGDAQGKGIDFEDTTVGAGGGG